MSRKYKFHNPNGIYFVSFAVRDWIEVFIHEDYKKIIVENLAFCQKNKGLEIFAWCIMTNHVHLLIRAKEEALLQNILRDFKKFSSKAITNAIQNSNDEKNIKVLLPHFITPDGYRFWHADNHPIEVWSNAVIKQKINYIHQNPVKKGLVLMPEHYLYSSAVDYAGKKGLLDIILI